jgi:hypothetical protein
MLILQAAQTALTQAEKTQTWLTFMAGWIALGFLGLFGLLILWYVFTERIDLSGLINEPTGEASMSRFQLLIFTFVIAASLFLIVSSATPPDFPKLIPQGILVLLGISSSSYLVSKGIQASSPQGLSRPNPQVTIKAGSNSAIVGGKPLQFQVDVIGLTDESVTWSIDPIRGAGTIDVNGLYTPPAATEPGLKTGKITIKATSVEDVSLTDIRNIQLVMPQ